MELNSVSIIKKSLSKFINRFENFFWNHYTQFFPIIEFFQRIRLSITSDVIYYKNTFLPAKYLRLCGDKFQDDQFFFNSSQAEALRLKQVFNLGPNSSLLDVGCGVGRLAIGILNRIGEIRSYQGIDVDRKSILWCNLRINSKYPTFHFLHINMQNLLYNPQGNAANELFRLPFDDHAFDIIYLYSVFSHMTINDIRLYLKEFHRLLSPSGKIFLTGFFEENVPKMTVNPPDYRMQFKQILHCVRYDKKFFEDELAKFGFTIDRFEYEKETNGQSAFYLSKKS